MSKVSKRPSVVMPTSEEDKAITTAAKADPDAHPLTPAAEVHGSNASTAWPPKVREYEATRVSAL